MSASPSAIYLREAIATVSEDQIENLKKLALENPLKRCRLCLHHSNADLVQEMVIVLHKDTYVRPHRHRGKSESFHMIEGSVAIAFFEDSGDILRILQLDAIHRKTFLYRLSDPLWHTVIPLTEFTVFHEVTTGPFSASEYPSWEPEQTEKAQKAFKQDILRRL